MEFRSNRALIFAIMLVSQETIIANKFYIACFLYRDNLIDRLYAQVRKYLRTYIY